MKSFQCVTAPLCLSLVQGPLWCYVCIIKSYGALLNSPIVSLLFFFIFFSIFFVLIHDYTLCFTGSPCCKFSYYNYISIWHCYIVIHLLLKLTTNQSPVFRHAHTHTHKHTSRQDFKPAIKPFDEVNKRWKYIMYHECKYNFIRYQVIATQYQD